MSCSNSSATLDMPAPSEPTPPAPPHERTNSTDAARVSGKEVHGGGRARGTHACTGARMHARAHACTLTRDEAAAGVHLREANLEALVLDALH